MYATLFETCLRDLEADKRHARIFTDFLDTGWISRQYLETATPAELVRDFLAGMTDRYFAKRYEECVIPRRIEGKFRR
jgi:dGTPase